MVPQNPGGDLAASQAKLGTMQVQYSHGLADTPGASAWLVAQPSTLSFMCQAGGTSETTLRGLQEHLDPALHELLQAVCVTLMTWVSCLQGSSVLSLSDRKSCSARTSVGTWPLVGSHSQVTSHNPS